MNSPFPFHPRSLSGAKLDGDQLVCCVFLDESGTSVSDPIVVVAGVLIDGNTQWSPIEEALAALRDRYVSPDQMPHFKGFHATEMFQGAGKVLELSHTRPLDESHTILEQVIKLPAQFKLPVVFGYTRKVDSPSDLKTPAQRRDSIGRHHALAASFCAIQADNYLKQRCPNDLAWAVAEDNTDTKGVVSDIYELIKKAGQGLAGFEIAGRGVIYSLEFRPGDIPLTKIVSGFHYVSTR